MSAPTALERRYRRLLWAYPKGYRTDRGGEIVGTYLDLAGTDRRWPSVADAVDLLRGGLRQRLRAADLADIRPGAGVAATLALTTAAALAASWLTYFEIAPNGYSPLVAWFGPFLTVGALAWPGWLVAAAVAAAAPGRWARVGVGLAVLLTVVVLPVSALTGQLRPPLFVLLPQVALGLVALALPAYPGRIARVFPALGATVGGLAPAAVGHHPLLGSLGYWNNSDVLTGAALVLTMAALLSAVTSSAKRRGDQGVWTLVLLGPALGLLLTPTMARTYLTEISHNPPHVPGARRRRARADGHHHRRTRGCPVPAGPPPSGPPGERAVTQPWRA